ncbi:MAG: tail protein X [Aeromonas veronii]
MKMIYTTREKDMLDDVVHRHYSGDKRGLRLALEANPGLSRLGPVLPAGIDVILPALPVVSKKVINILG